MAFITRKTANYSIPDSQDDEIIVYESGSFAVILPYAKGTGRQLTIVNYGTGEITVQAQPLDNLHGSTSMILQQNESMSIKDADDQLWIII